jgi:hypothetical protein
MEIKKIVRRLSMEYLLVWLLSLGIVVLYETGVMEEGTWAHDGRIRNVLQTVTILLTLCLIPVSLKMFSAVLNKRVLPLENAESKLLSYLHWSEVRLALMAIVALIGLSVYYTTLSSIGGLCALVGLLASLFCLPGEEKVKNELNLNNDEV